MATIKEVVERLERNKQERKKLKELLNEARAGSASWVRIKEEVDEDKARLKQVELAIFSDYKSEVEELERLKREIQNDTMVLSDIALSLIMKGDGVDQVETNGRRYEPRVTVSFKQMRLL